MLLKRAFDAASVWHKDQYRKYPGVLVPYMSHIAGVAATLARHGFSEEVQAAGALHDVIEDCEVTHAALATRFGNEVADLVRDVSEQDKTLSWEERKRAYVEHFAHKRWEAQAISLADKIDNFRSIVVCAADHGDPWAMFKRGRDAQIERFRALEAHAVTLPAHPLIEEYVLTLRELEAV